MKKGVNGSLYIRQSIHQHQLIFCKFAKAPTAFADSLPRRDWRVGGHAISLDRRSTNLERDVEMSF
jgi:hypothetical protein